MLVPTMTLSSFLFDLWEVAVDGETNSDGIGIAKIIFKMINISFSLIYIIYELVNQEIFNPRSIHYHMEAVNQYFRDTNFTRLKILVILACLAEVILLALECFYFRRKLRRRQNRVDDSG